MTNYSYQEENIKLLLEAEKIALKISFDLKSFYVEKVLIRNQYTQQNDGNKVPYEDLVKANSFGANNGFKGILLELESIIYLVDELHDGDFEAFRSDEYNRAIYAQNLKLLENHFIHICKWIWVDKNN